MTIIPEETFKKHKILIVHPGIVGDRGASSLDLSIMRNDKRWGVTLLEASEEVDHGDIWGTGEFPLKGTETKTDIYNM